MTYIIKRYSSEAKGEWDSFVTRSRNAIFLFYRDFVDYHADRIQDFSLMIYKSRQGSNPLLSAILPANIVGNTLYSHQGLSFGGFLLPDRHPDPAELLEILKASLNFCRLNNIETLVYKVVPSIYPQAPSQEDIYALWRCNASIAECNISMALNPKNNPGFSTLQRRLIKKASPLFDIKKFSTSSVEGRDGIAIFHKMLSECLRERHNASPVHSFEELLLLMERFPNNIHLFCALDKDENPAAGILIFESQQVAHCQYIATSPHGRELHALPFLVDYLLKYFEDKCFFDFGTSNEQHGSFLNAGLVHQKNSFGATGVAHLIFNLSTSYNLPHTSSSLL